MTSLTRIGNSQGVRIPKAIVEQAHLENKKLIFKVVDEGLLIQPVESPRQGWKEQFDKALKSQGSAENDTDDEWLEAPLTEIKDWEW